MLIGASKIIGTVSFAAFLAFSFGPFKDDVSASAAVIVIHAFVCIGVIYSEKSSRIARRAIPAMTGSYAVFVGMSALVGAGHASLVAVPSWAAFLAAACLGALSLMASLGAVSPHEVFRRHAGLPQEELAG